MKNILVVVILLISLPLLSQVKDRTEYQSYYIKQPKFTGNQVVEMNYKSVFLDLGEGNYVVDIKLTPDTFMQAKVTYSKTMEFARQTIYIYEGTGSLYLKPMNFVIESTVKLSELCKGNAYKKGDKNLISDYGIHILYWSTEIREPLLKNNFSIYPIQNVEIEEVEIVEEYKEPLLAKLEEHYTICVEEKIRQITTDDLNYRYDYGEGELILKRTMFCEDEKESVQFDFFPNELYDGLYCFVFKNKPIEEVVALVQDTYQVYFDDTVGKQRYVSPTDNKNFYEIEQVKVQGVKNIKIIDRYENEPNSTFMGIQEISENDVLVTIYWDGV